MHQEKAHTQKTLVLSSKDINKIVRHYGLDTIMDKLIERIAIAFENFDPEQTVIPIRSGFNYTEPHTGLVEWMPLYKKGEEVVIKVVGYHPENPDVRQLPTILSTISIYDTSTGHLNGIMDGVFLTALRTAAASAVASRTLAHPESKTFGIIGCGAQAVTQLHALSRVFTCERILFYDLDPETQKSFEKRCEILNLDARFSAVDIETIVQHADILCTATSIEVGAGPLFSGVASKEHLHVNAVGSDFPGKTELPLDLLRQSFVCPDFPDQAVVEGECQQLKAEEIGPGFMEVIQNKGKYRDLVNQRTVFDSTGLPLEDQVVADLFFDYANQLKLGQRIAIEYLQEDAKNPYHFLNAEMSEQNTNEVLELLPLERNALENNKSTKITEV